MSFIELIKEDFQHWCSIYQRKYSLYSCLVILFDFPEFRVLLRRRLNSRWFILLKAILYLSTLHLNLYVSGDKLGRRCFFLHGFSTIVGFQSMGSDCWIAQQVTIGWGRVERNGNHLPIIEDHVKFGPGCKVLGGIIIGKNSYIGANAVVTKDVPPNSMVVGCPGRVIKRYNEITKTWEKV